MSHSSIELRNNLTKIYQNQFELDVGEGGFVLLTVISERFRKITRAQRLQQIEPLIHKAGLTVGIVELYAPEEAKKQGVTLSVLEDTLPASWQEAINRLASGKAAPNKKPVHPIKRVVFYSYKGGVGRTSALIQTAFQLTRAGKRVILVDMDVEAPGLQTLLPPSKGPLEEGLVDYLWEKQTSLEEKITVHGNSGIVYSVTDSHSKRPLFIVPAGKIGARYVQRLSALTTAHLFAKADDPWGKFEQAIWKQFQPDIMLIDARTGLNEWGGLSLLQLADNAFFVLYPSEQNAEGVRFIQELLKNLNNIEAQLNLSPVPEGIIGAKLVEKITSSLALNKTQQKNIIQIPYHPDITGGDKFPIETALPYYSKIANYLLEINSEEEAGALITQSNRLSLVKSLSFPERDASSILDADFDAIFQKTVDFERCLDDRLWVIRGRKGTGKSTLYTLFTQHRENAEKRSRGRLENITVLSAHGGSNDFRPTGDIFSTIQRKLSEKQTDWLSLWRAYAVICIYRSCPEFLVTLTQFKLKRLLLRLKDNFSGNVHRRWESKQTNKLLELAMDDTLNACCRDALSHFNQLLKEENRKIWLLYDDLDQDIQEGSAWQKEALGGLLRLLYDSNNQNLYQITFKLFLREDIWSSLVFTNKSHFGEARTLLLQWGKADFFRLAYRLAIGGSADFKTLSNRILPLAENEIDEADEDALRKALAPLWGLRQKSKNAYVAQWVYTRLTDASDNTYPRSLTILLNKACAVELDSKQGRLSPRNHILRWNSLTEGLAAASEERCNAIKNEYSEFADFFEHINELSSLFKVEDLEKLWKKTIADKTKLSFDGFSQHLQEIGLIAKKKYNKRYDYSVANLYVYGFGVQRKQGQRK